PARCYLLPRRHTVYTLFPYTTLFRSSVPAIQEVVNSVFSRAIQAAEDGSQPEYVGLEGFRAETDGQPAVIALPAPRVYSDYGNQDRKSTRLNSSHVKISYAVFCLKKK